MNDELVFQHTLRLRRIICQHAENLVLKGIVFYRVLFGMKLGVTHRASGRDRFVLRIRGDDRACFCVDWFIRYFISTEF